MLAGLSRVYILRTPPCFWAAAGPLVKLAASNAAVTVNARNFWLMRSSPYRLCCTLLVEPDVFHARTIGDAVDHNRQALPVRPPAGRAAVVEENLSGAVLRQLPFDLPHQLLALFLVGLDRLSIDQLVDIRIAITVIVQFAAAPVIQVEALVSVVT